MKLSKKKWKLETKALQSGYQPDNISRSRAVPIYQSVAHLFQNTDKAARLFAGEEEGFIYSRINNPTCDVFEKRMADLEEGEAALSTSSGMAAIFLTVIALAKSGDEIVSSNRIYGGTFHLFRDTLPQLGIKVKFVTSPQNLFYWDRVINKKTKLLFLESPSNPKAEVFDIKAIAKVAKRHNIPLVVDSTLATPVLQKPLSLGADIVIHSATKFLCGSGTSLGGVVIGPKKFISNLRNKEYRDIGPALSPFNAWNFLLGMETLKLRMVKHSENALLLAEFLESHPKVAKVYYPGLKNSPYFSLVKKQMGGLAGGLMAFEINGSRREGAKFIENLELCSHVANLGDAKTLAIHPASTTHSQLSKKDLEQAGISETIVRLSVGLENIEDIIFDIKQALAKIK